MTRTIIGAAVFVLSVHAQVGTASLSGVVTDPTGSVIPDASVTLDSASQKYRRATMTGPTGEYTLSDCSERAAGPRVGLAGRRVAAQAGGNDNANIGTVAGRLTQYPNLVGDPNAIDHRTPQMWFNTAAFAQPPLYTFGNAGRNILRTDSLTNLDAAVFKRLPWGEKRRVELRGEAFNAMNHPSFGYPGVTLGASQFGKISNTRNSGRQIQVALKFHF